MFYIYAYLREDGTPYYIGKGKGERSNYKSKKHRIKVPDFDRIVIMESNLTEIGAFALERFYIRWYGRKDIGTGILRNLTDGGDGVSGIRFSDETKKKMSDARKGKSRSPETIEKIRKSHLGKKHTDETKKKLSEKRSGEKRKPLSEETKRKIGEANRRWMTGRVMSDETKKKISETMKVVRRQCST
jgi:hypothetical protein